MNNWDTKVAIRQSDQGHAFQYMNASHASPYKYKLRVILHNWILQTSDPLKLFHPHYLCSYLYQTAINFNSDLLDSIAKPIIMVSFKKLRGMTDTANNFQITTEIKIPRA